MYTIFTVCKLYNCQEITGIFSSTTPKNDYESNVFKTIESVIWNTIEFINESASKLFCYLKNIIIISTMIPSNSTKLRLLIIWNVLYSVYLKL